MRKSPILAALLRHKVAAGLIAAQIALTLAIIANALYIVIERSQLMARPSGVAEQELFVLGLTPNGSPEQRRADLLADLDAVRKVPGVAGAYLTNSLPMSGGGWSSSVNLTAEDTGGRDRVTALYMADESSIDTLGLKLVAGRNFEPGELQWQEDNKPLRPQSVIITEALARRLFGDQPAVGRMIGISGVRGDVGTRVVGVVERLVTPWAGWGQFEQSTLVPIRSDGGPRIAVRVRPGRLDETVKAVEEALWARNPQRVVDGRRTMPEMRAEQYQSDRALVIIMAAITLSLLAVTALGIVGQASFWVTQRTRQIGVRRALGATRGQILRYFQAENAIIAGFGIVVGVTLAYVVNYWMAENFGADRLPWFYLPIGAAIVLLLGQVAVYAPARRAAQVPPAIATRSA
ncbi:MAG: ABC transporter permease [Pseudomonadota bacterium]|jgi:putative ABC transport system permease protein